MLDWHKPSFTFGIMESLYYFNLYHKIMEQGTQEDKFRLIELYNKSKERANGNPCIAAEIFKFFSLMEHHQYACEKFIYEKKMEHFDDDIARAREVKRIDSEKTIKELNKKMYGYDPEEKKMKDEIFELRLNMEHTPDQKKFVLDGKGFHVHPSLDKVKQQKLLHSDETVIKRVDGNVTIHHRIYDMCDGFYTTIVWADNSPVINGVQQVFGGYSAMYSGPVGVVQIMEKNITKVKFDILCYTYENGNSSTTSSKKVKSVNVNIDKINKALGIDDTDDDLNGDIF
jgi:hypothetical protein